MSVQKFEECNRLANINLNNKGQLSEFLKSYLSLSQELGKEQIAYEGIVELPPSNTLNNPDPSIDVIVSVCEQSLSNMKNTDTISMGIR